MSDNRSDTKEEAIVNEREELLSSIGSWVELPQKYPSSIDDKDLQSSVRNSANKCELIHVADQMKPSIQAMADSTQPQSQIQSQKLNENHTSMDPPHEH